MNKILYIIIAVLILSSCNKKFEDLNVDPKNPSAVPSGSLFTSAQKTMGDQIASTNVNRNNFKLWSQYWTETTYLDESNYDVLTRNVPDNSWTEWYRDAISDLTKSQEVLATEPVIPGDEQVVANKNAIADLLIIYSYQRLVDLFGNVPYSEAMDAQNNLLPAYDDAWTIYQSLAARTDAAIAAMDPSSGSYGAQDLMYGGDVASWIAFAHGMKVKMGITVSDAQPAMGQAWVEGSYDKSFTSNAGNCQLAYLSSTPNTNPLYVDLILTGREDFVAAVTICDTMNFYNDGRRPEYFTLDANGGYSGGNIGETSSFADLSKPGAKLKDPTFPVLLMSYDEISFYLADAAERGWSVGGSAQQHYENGVNASFEYWGVPGDAAAHLATDNIAWGTGNSSNVEKITRESWVAFYSRGFVAWTQIRRLDFPLALSAAPQDGHYPIRYTYPVNEQTLNPTSWSAAASAIGGDVSDTPIFWDVN